MIPDKTLHTDRIYRIIIFLFWCIITFFILSGLFMQTVSGLFIKTTGYQTCSNYSMIYFISSLFFGFIIIVVYYTRHSFINKPEENRHSLIYYVVIILMLSFMLRIFVMFKGYNFDFLSYTIVGNLVMKGGNVFKETSRYNYGPLFSIIQGSFYNVSIHFTNSVFFYRLLIVFLLTVFDVFIALVSFSIYRKISIIALFLLNPVTVIITGYHNQFDNMAVFFGLFGVISINRKNNFSKEDVISILFLSLSLITKHLLFIFPFWILINHNLIFKKRLIYSSIPVFVFILSFVPYLHEGYNGIIQNVFMYKSFDNFPLLHGFLKYILHIDLMIYYREFFIILLLLLGFILRKMDFQKLILYYFIGLVCFSSAIANQYLAIPVISLWLLKGRIKYVYFLYAGLFLIFQKDGLGLCNVYSNQALKIFLRSGYFVSASVLLFFLLYNLYIEYIRPRSINDIDNDLNNKII